MSSELFDGLAIGFAVAVPFGPVSLICVQRALKEGISFAIVSGLGAATAHGVFSTLARAWSDALGGLLIEFHTPIRLVSAVVMVLFGATVICKRSLARPPTGTSDLLAAYGSTLLLALCNPMTMLPYIASASGAASRAPLNSLGSLVAVIGVMLGAMSWYLALSSTAFLFRCEISARTAGRLNLAAGGMLIGLGSGIAIGWL